MRYLRLGFLPLIAVTLLSCAKPPSAAPQFDADARLQSIPSADPAKFGSVHDFKSWRNPYLMVSKEGVSLLDFAHNEQRSLKLEELPQALAGLPPSAWPYGRVVALAEDKPGTPGDDVLIRKNRGIVAGTLESLHILINWVPSS
jgi:hypothetical protein